MILVNQGRLMLNHQKVPLPNVPQRSPGFVQKKPPGVQLYLKETPTLVFLCEICEFFKNIYFEKHLRKTASVCFTSKYYSK